ncbi:ATP-dependent DNA helicase Q1 [Mycena venus]|uniref:DNA 3'-5' helicase n=1 Tax=Mycena venus TaxID=2733690 RepID=A0A8H7DBQ3_9AGAR|nr:ATP-dependent DNA helicase Q1 [Mycena venus]
MACGLLALLLFLALLSQIVFSFKFHSPQGFTLVRKILLDALPHFEPHDYQTDGISVTPTGSGKTGFLFLTIIVMIAIANIPSLCPTVKFPKDPVIVVVCPTNSIEQQMDENMAKLGIAALTINSDTIFRGAYHWRRSLISKGFRDLLAHEPFYERVCALGVDEIHLLVSWGLLFRKAFQQIGFMRARLRPGIPVIGLTATMLGDTSVADAIYALLGVNRGEFYLLRRSNARYDIQVLFRQLVSGIDGRKFPELAWILQNRDKTLVFCRTISLVFRVKAYLNSLLPDDPHRDFRIRTHTGLDWPDYKLQTLSDIVTEPKCQVIIATNGLAQGNDIKVITTVIQIGEPESIDMYVQKQGRARPTVKNPRAIFYISANRMDLATKTVEQTDAENEMDARRSAAAKTSTPQMSRSVAEILTADCKPSEQDRQYSNPDSDPACLLAASPSQSRRRSSIGHLQRLKKAASDIPPHQRLTKIMKIAGTTRLEEFQYSVWAEASDHTMGLTPLADFLPDLTIKKILDRFAKIQSFGDLVPYIKDLRGIWGYHVRLFEVINELRETFCRMRKSGQK